MKRLLVNDALTQIEGTKTFWHDLQEWFGLRFIGADYSMLIDHVEAEMAGISDNYEGTSLIIRNASYFGPIKSDIPTISLLQDIFQEGESREMQEEVIRRSHATVFNSEFTADKYSEFYGDSAARALSHTIPLPVDFSIFEPGNAMGLQTAYSLPDGCVCWVGAQSEIKGWDIFLQVVRQNPDISFVAVFKDSIPIQMPPNMRAFHRLPTEELVKVIGACRVGLCTSRMESQHLAGIEMGACGLPMVAPPVGVYYERKTLPGTLVQDATVEAFTAAVRVALARPNDAQAIRAYWKEEFDKPVIKARWKRIVEEVESETRSG